MSKREEVRAPIAMDVFVCAGEESAQSLCPIIAALVESSAEDLVVTFHHVASPAPRISIAGIPYDGPLRFAALLAAICQAKHVNALITNLGHRDYDAVTRVIVERESHVKLWPIVHGTRPADVRSTWRPDYETHHFDRARCRDHTLTRNVLHRL